MVQQNRPPIPRRLFVAAWEGRPGPLIAAGRTANKHYAQPHRVLPAENNSMRQRAPLQEAA